MSKLWLPFVLMALVCGCGADGTVGARPDPVRQQMARAEVAEYDRAVLDAGRRSFVPTGNLTGRVGALKGAQERALQAGRIDSAGTLPGAPRRTGTVVWARGVTQPVPLISAGDALDQIRATATGDCPACDPLEVTSARLATTRVRTARGPATAPAWIYTLRGTSAQVTRLAVARLAMVTPAHTQPIEPAGDVTVESATTASLRDRSLTVTFVGSPGPGGKPCGADYTAQAVESANAVDVVVTAHTNRSGSGACVAIGALRTAEVLLSGPLADRVVLDGTQSRPVPVTITR